MGATNIPIGQAATTARKPNEVPIPATKLTELFRSGATHTLSVFNGPAGNAELVGVRWKDGKVVLVYDRDVADMLILNSYGGEWFRSS